MKICSACGHALTPDGPCGFASVTVGEKTTWLCHADDHSCYMESGWHTDDVSLGLGFDDKPLPDAAEGIGEIGSVSSRPSPGTDPRVEAILNAGYFVDAEDILAAADAADKAAGIVRVDTGDEATVSEIVWAIVNHNTLSGGDLDGTARAVLAALRGER